MYLNTVCHAVLALLSEGYPPLEGRSPTRYSPVCHATNPLRGLRVRLACIRHAASVDSEPGSNSQVKVGALRSPLTGLTQSKPFNPRSLNVRLFGFNPPSPSLALELRQTRLSKEQFVRPRHLTAASARRCPLILDGLCLHVLSSFQRTGCPFGPPHPDVFSVRRGTFQAYDAHQALSTPLLILRFDFFRSKTRHRTRRLADRLALWRLVELERLSVDARFRAAAQDF